MLVCLTITFESLDVEVHIYTSGVSLGVKFTYECYLVKVKVTGAKKVNTAFDNDPIRSPQCESRHNPLLYSGEVCMLLTLFGYGGSNGEQAIFVT